MKKTLANAARLIIASTCLLAGTCAGLETALSGKEIGFTMKDGSPAVTIGIK